MSCQIYIHMLLETRSPPRHVEPLPSWSLNVVKCVDNKGGGVDAKLAKLILASDDSPGGMGGGGRLLFPNSSSVKNSSSARSNSLSVRVFHVCQRRVAVLLFVAGSVVSSSRSTSAAAVLVCLRHNEPGWIQQTVVCVALKTLSYVLVLVNNMF